MLIRRRHRRGPWLRDDPSDTGTPTPGGGGAPSPPAPPAPPTPQPFDPSTLSPEAQAYLRQREAEADRKARTGAKENAAKEERSRIQAELAEKLGLKPAEVDPQKVAAELAAERAEKAALLAEKAIGRVCRAADVSADEDLVMAVLQQRGALKGLDLSDAEAVKKLVVDLVTEKPNLKIGAPAAPPAGGRQPGANFPPPTDSKERPSLTEAISRAYGATASR